MGGRLHRKRKGFRLMAFSVTSGSVVSTSGRGRNKTVDFEVDFSELERWAKRMGVDTERVMRRSYGRAVSGLKAKFAKVMRSGGGDAGVPRFRNYEDFTRELRRVRGAVGKMGGVLADKAHIVGFRRGEWQIIGWPDRLAKWAVNFQDGVGSKPDPFANPKVRWYYHRLGIRDVPTAYLHNPRRVTGPFGAYVAEHLDRWARDAYHKELARQMKKAGDAARVAR